jgi:hypothetical protein
VGYGKRLFPVLSISQGFNQVLQGRCAVSALLSN